MSQSQPNPTLQAVLNRCRYSPATKQALLGELSFLLSTYETLAPESSKFGNGESVDKGSVWEGVSLAGTIKALYQGQSFNIPIRIQYRDGYPINPPLVWIEPTSDMVLRANEFVDSRGCVKSEYLKTWTRHCSSALLLKDLADLFAYKMPVFSKSARSFSPLPSRSTKRDLFDIAMPDLQQYVAPLVNAYNHRAGELVSEIEDLRADRRDLRLSAEEAERVRVLYTEDLVLMT